MSTSLPRKYDPALVEKLTLREQAFIQHPTVMVNAEQAAIDAGYSASWARRNAASKRKQLMYFILPETHKRWAAKGITLERIHEELACIAFSDEADYYERVETEDGGELLVGKDPTLLPEGMRRAIQQIELNTVVLGSGTPIQFPSFVLHDKKTALKMLAEMLGGFDPRVREPGDSAERRRQAELFEFMNQTEIDTIVKIYRRAEERQKKAAVEAAPIEMPAGSPT